jgi:hypothetical protein
MREDGLNSVPIVDGDGRLEGILSAGDIATYDMRSMYVNFIENVPLFNLLSTLEGTLVNEYATSVTEVSGELDIEELIEVEDCVVTYTNKGYVKRTTLDEYKTQKRGGRGVQGMKQREEDFVEEMFICSTHDNILFITNKGYMYKLKCYEIPDGSKASRGFHFANLLNLQEGERISAMLRCRTFDTDDYVVMVTKKGQIKRTPLTAYRNIYNKRGLIAIGLNDGTQLPVDGLFCLRDAISLNTLLPGLAAENGHIVVDRAMATNLPGVYAAGDCTGRPYQYTKAVGEGNVAAHSVLDYLAGKA